MKIGIFGDSFADCNGCKERWNTPGWSDFIKDNYDIKAGAGLSEVTSYARSGTSTWFSRNLFLEHYKNYDVIIFSFTNAVRWPALPKHLAGREWNIGYQKDAPHDDFLDKVNPYFFELFPEEFTYFINDSVYKEVVDLCKDNGKYLISILPFYNDDDWKPSYVNDFSAITGLDDVSRREQMEVDGKLVSIWTELSNRAGGDEIRGNHLLPVNNKMLANWIIDCIDNKKYKQHLSGTDWQIKTANAEFVDTFLKHNMVK